VPTVRIDVVSIFPEYLTPLDLSLIGRALRDFTHDRHRTVDDTPFGGGAGMVMTPQPWAEALDHVLTQGPAGRRPHLLVPGPGGERFTQAMAHRLAAEEWLAFACGRYEGIDERVLEHAREDLGLEVSVVSLGDYVLNGGEVAVLAVVEAVARLLPGVVGNAESLVEESHEDGLLEYPVYTRPASWSAGGVTREVPDVLLSGDHGRIADWRHTERLRRTAERRPDLLHASGAVQSLDDLAVDVATPADAPEILVLQMACWVPEARANATWTIPPLVETVDDVVASIGEWTTWVLRSADRLVASVRARVSPDDPTVWQLSRLMVAPDLQGRGLGQAVLALAEDAAPPQVRRFWLNTGSQGGRNLRICRKAGYRVVPGEGAWPGTVDLTKPRR
jgi:tRNA (guanine37-N1)-methyltransferase